MKGRIRWSPRSVAEEPSPGTIVFFNPDAGYSEKLTFPPYPTKLTDPDHSVRRVDKDAMADMIIANGPWGWYCTLTFRSSTILEKTAHHHFMRWIRGINEELYGWHFREKRIGVTFARATEHQRNGRIHYHVLISKEVRRLRRLTYKDYWEYGFPRYHKIQTASRSLTEISSDGGNGFARIDNYNAGKAGQAERYLVKYMTKERDIFLYRPLGRPDR